MTVRAAGRKLGARALCAREAMLRIMAPITYKLHNLRRIRRENASRAVACDRRAQQFRRPRNLLADPRRGAPQRRQCGGPLLPEHELECMARDSVVSIFGGLSFLCRL